jgi:hypothetical protein
MLGARVHRHHLRSPQIEPVEDFPSRLLTQLVGHGAVEPQTPEGFEVAARRRQGSGIRPAGERDGPLKLLPSPRKGVEAELTGR